MCHIFSTGTPEFEAKLEEALFMLQSSDICSAAVKAYTILLDTYFKNEGNNSSEDNVVKLKERLQLVNNITNNSFV